MDWSDDFCVCQRWHLWIFPVNDTSRWFCPKADHDASAWCVDIFPHLPSGFVKHCNGEFIYFQMMFPWKYDEICLEGGISQPCLMTPRLSRMIYHIISYHIISYHISSYHIISYHIISYCITIHVLWISHHAYPFPLNIALRFQPKLRLSSMPLGRACSLALITCRNP